MKIITPAEELLKSLGVTSPDEIDLEAIAWTQGVRVYFKPLDGCEARIIGVGDTAIATVNSKGSPGRRRFSLAHELGHWKHHRGQFMVCRSDEIGDFSNKASQAERHADSYAANLLMPRYLFLPSLRTFRKLDFEIIRKLSEIYGVSLTATAIRCISLGDEPAMVICHNHHGRRWFQKSSLIPDYWFPRKDLQAESSALDILYGKTKSSSASQLRCVSAEAWFDNYRAPRYEVVEQTIKISDTEILTLILFEDNDMLEE